MVLFEERRARIPDYRPPQIEKVDAEAYYGRGYQDILTRKPSIAKARRLLGWEPKVTLDDALAHTVDAFLEDWIRSEAATAPSAGD